MNSLVIPAMKIQLYKQKVGLMKTLVVLAIGVFSWLLANETRQSAVDVASGIYWEVPGVLLTEQYIILSYVFSVISVVCLLLAIASVMLISTAEARRK